MTTTTQPNEAGQTPVTANSAPTIKRLWKDTERLEQIARIRALHLQSCDREGLKAWEEASRIHANLPRGVRIDLPSPRVFARVLGFYRTAASLKHRPMLEFEMSVKDIAEAVGYSKSAVEAALRWLSGEPIVYQRMQVARGLGYVSRARRKAKAFVQGVYQNVYRTTQTALTLIGRAFVGLGSLLVHVGQALTPKRSKKRPTSPARREPQQEVALERDWNGGADAVKKILEQLRT